MSFILKSLVKIKTETLGLESTQNLACTIFRRNPFLPETEQSPKPPVKPPGSGVCFSLNRCVCVGGVGINGGSAEGLTFPKAPFLTPPIQPCYQHKGLEKQTMCFFLVPSHVALMKSSDRSTLRGERLISAYRRGSFHHGVEDKTAGSWSSRSRLIHNGEQRAVMEFLLVLLSVSLVHAIQAFLPEERLNLSIRWVIQYQQRGSSWSLTAMPGNPCWVANWC